MAMRSSSGLTASLARLALTPAVSSSSAAAIASTSTLSRRVAPNSRPSARSYATTLQPPSQYSIGHLSPAQPAKKAKRLGRGDSSGRGGTSTRGHKGQKARTGNGKPTPGFEGGQTPIMRRFPKRGFVNSFAHETVPLNLSRLQTWIDSGRLDPSAPITVRELYLSRCIHRLGDGGVKLLGDGAEVLSQPLKLVVSRASTTAIKAVEKAGGSITCKYYTPLTLRALVKPEKWTGRGRLLPRESMPINRRDLLYYSDIRNRGYLAKMHVLGNGEGLTSPSSSAPPSADAVAEANDIVAEEEARVAQQAQAGEIKREDAAAAV